MSKKVNKVQKMHKLCTSYASLCMSQTQPCLVQFELDGLKEFWEKLEKCKNHMSYAWSMHDLCLMINAPRHHISELDYHEIDLCKILAQLIEEWSRKWEKRKKMHELCIFMTNNACHRHHLVWITAHYDGKDPCKISAWFVKDFW